MSMKTRQVLTVNQVYQIIAKFVECNDWKQAFGDVTAVWEESYSSNALGQVVTDATTPDPPVICIYLL